MTINNKYPIIPVLADLKILTSGYGDYNITVQALSEFILASGGGMTPQEVEDLINTKIESLTKSDVGLSNVDNTSDTSKPVSVAQQTALNNKINWPAIASEGDHLVFKSGQWVAEAPTP